MREDRWRLKDSREWGPLQLTCGLDGSASSILLRCTWSGTSRRFEIWGGGNEESDLKEPLLKESVQENGLTGA